MSLVWFNGKLSRGGTIELPADNRGLWLGDGLFETMLMVKGKVAELDAHLSRMANSAGVLGLGYSDAAVRVAVGDLGAASDAPVNAVRVRLLRGDPAILLATATAFDIALICKSQRLATVSIRRNPHSIASTHKTLSYIDSIAALREAEKAGADGALMMNTLGKVASSAIANLFLLKGDTLITPGVDQGILPGTTRARLLRDAGSLGLRPVERVVDQSELFTVDAIFLANALRLLTPVTQIDGRLTGTRDCRFILNHLIPEHLKEHIT